MKTAMKTMSVKLEENTINEIKKISSIFEISYSDFIRKALEDAITEKQKDFMYRMSGVPFASDEEEKIITEELSKLEDDDLMISRVDEITL